MGETIRGSELEIDKAWEEIKKRLYSVFVAEIAEIQKDLNLPVCTPGSDVDMDTGFTYGKAGEQFRHFAVKTIIAELGLSSRKMHKEQLSKKIMDMANVYAKALYDNTDVADPEMRGDYQVELLAGIVAENLVV